MAFNFYEDPGHGWMKVPLATLVELGIADKISSYSYMRNESAYLEEDCDASVFFNAWRAKYGVDPKLVRCFTNNQSRIRNYRSYRVI